MNVSTLGAVLVRGLARLTLVLIAGELLAMAAFALTLRDQLRDVWQIDGGAVVAAVGEADIAAFREQFHDPVLGWTYKPTTTALPYTAFDERGARRDARAWNGRVAAYGDALTFGADIADDETWPHLLGELLGHGVANFGVAGYGLDQAFLRLHQNTAAFGPPDVAILGLPSDAIARAVNAWSYLYDRAEPLAFKPMLEVGGGRWLPNPLAVLEGRESIEAARAAAQAAPDYWRQFNDWRPVPEFPYLWAVADTADYLLMRRRHWRHLWQEPRAVATLDAIVDEIVSLARVRGYRPVLLMIPLPEDLRGPASYAAFVAQTRTTYGDRLVVADPLERELDPARFYQRPGVISAYGNRVLAGTVFAALRNSP